VVIYMYVIIWPKCWEFVNHVKHLSDYFFFPSEDFDIILFVLHYIVVPHLVVCLCYLVLFPRVPVSGV